MNEDSFKSNDLCETLLVNRRNGATVVDLFLLIKDYHSEETFNRITIFREFKNAFKLPLGEVMRLGSWIGFPEGTMNNEETEKVFKEVIVSNKISEDPRMVPKVIREQNSDESRMVPKVIREQNSDESEGSEPGKR